MNEYEDLNYLFNHILPKVKGSKVAEAAEGGGYSLQQVAVQRQHTEVGRGGEQVRGEGGEEVVVEGEGVEGGERGEEGGGEVAQLVLGEHQDMQVPEYLYQKIKIKTQFLLNL